jgi:hypothetical protein
VGNSIAGLNLKGLTAGGPFSLEENKNLLTPSLHLLFICCIKTHSNGLNQKCQAIYQNFYG